METYYYTGKIRISNKKSESDIASATCFATYANASVSVSPEYVTHRNILFNDVSILKGYRLGIEIELLFNRQGEDDNQIDGLIAILNSLKENVNGVDGFNRNIEVQFFNKLLDVPVKSFYFNKLESSIQLTDYISDNMNLGQIFKIKLSQGNLYQTIPLWVSDENLINTVLGDVDFIVAIDY